MVTIPSHGWFMALLFNHCIFSDSDCDRDLQCIRSDQRRDVDVAPCTGLKTRRQRLRISEADAQESSLSVGKARSSGRNIPETVAKRACWW